MLESLCRVEAERQNGSRVGCSYAATSRRPHLLLEPFDGVREMVLLHLAKAVADGDELPVLAA